MFSKKFRLILAAVLLAVFAVLVITAMFKAVTFYLPVLVFILLLTCVEGEEE